MTIQIIFTLFLIAGGITLAFLGIRDILKMRKEE